MMPKHFRVPRGLARVLAPGVLLAVVFLASPDSLFAQQVTGFNLQKTCPTVPVAPNSSFQCTYSLTNQGTNGVNNLVVTNQVPFPGGPVVPIDCNQAGSPVTSLGAAGTPTDTCTGSMTETAPPCGQASIFLVDEVRANGNDAVVTTLLVSGSATNAVVILACTPTPTNTPVNTPTNTPINTNTPTNTPVTTAPPPVPTLSFPMMVLLGLLLAGTGLFLARRQ
jgi:hypothetical protein